MTECIINGIPVKFPFEPYDIQKNYMSKVIECLTNDVHGVLESPTGTGKTLSLLCSSLAWLQIRKAHVQAQWQKAALSGDTGEVKDLNDIVHQLNNLTGKPNEQGGFMKMPQIIYSSRTHSQLSQAMQELKRSSYRHMNATVLGSREQMCIHPDIMKEESNAVKINMCRLKVGTRSCHFYNRVERIKDSPALMEQPVVDIEDIVKLGQNHKFCPYYMSKELKQKADIIFMPYNYLLDPRARKALSVELQNNVIILDEAHNIEKICEDSASLQLKNTDITLCIDEVTDVMKYLSEEAFLNFNETPPDFTPDELCTLKQIFLDFEKALDGIEIKNASEGVTFEGNYIFDIFQAAGIRDDNSYIVINLLEKLTTFLQTVNQGAFQRKGHGLKLFEDLLRIAFLSTKEGFREKIKKCYKVHVVDEEPPKQKATTWLSKTTKTGCRVLSYWCFSPGFGMNMLMDQGVKCVILTSGTLAPLNPLITELELNVRVRLENPHIVGENQVCVKILSNGPDGTLLNSNFQNRNNPAYVKSLGMTIANLARTIPNGLLIFFPSYPLMKKCRDAWQEEGLWSSITDQKNIFVEPQDKTAFNEAMVNYYKSVNDPNLNGAIFMGVCRGKVSEGLDFADANGRAVIITGLPYPPLKDPRIILKKRYLDLCRSKNKEYLGGDDWYGLEATKAVNQAIGRVIRHKDDYGAIILLDSRFNNPRIIGQMSLWLRSRIKHVSSFGIMIRELKLFFQETNLKFPVTKRKPIVENGVTQSVPAAFEVPDSYKKSSYFDDSTSSSSSLLNSTNEEASRLVTIHKRGGNVIANPSKRKKITVIPNEAIREAPSMKSNIKEYLQLVKNSLHDDEYKLFLDTVKKYRSNNDFHELSVMFNNTFLSKAHLRYIVVGFESFVKNEHRDLFNQFCDNFS